MSELQQRLRALAEKQAIVSWGGHNYSWAPEGAGVGVEAGIDHGYGVVPLPYVGVDIGTPHTGVRLGGPLPHIGLRSGLYTRTPGAASNPGHGKSLWGWLSQRGKSKKEVEQEDAVNNAARFRHLDPEDIAREMGTFDQWKKLPMKTRLQVAKELVQRGQAYEKESKVYEAGESVEGMPIKQTKMNHKKCTPGEFGMAVKEAANPIARMATGVGKALSQGAPQAAQKAMLNNREAIGFVRDLGGAIGRPMPSGYVRKSLQQAGQDAFRGQVQNNTIDAAGAAAAGVGVGYGAKYLDAYRTEADRLQQNAQRPTPSPVTPIMQRNPGAMAGVGSMIKTQSARAFGSHVKQGFDIQKYLPTAGVGAGIGAGIGALGGLINPGEEDEYDDNGRVIGRKQRSRFGAMMRNALMGAGVGGVAGGVAGYMSPATLKAVNTARAAFDPANYQEMKAIQQGKPLPANMRIPANLRASYNANQYGADIANSVDRVMSEQYNLAGRPNMNFNDVADIARNDVTGQDLPGTVDTLYPQYGVQGGHMGPALPNQ